MKKPVCANVQWFFRVDQNYLEGLLKHISEPPSRAYDSAGLGQGPIVCTNCISNKFSGDAVIAGLENILGEPLN